MEPPRSPTLAAPRGGPCGGPAEPDPRKTLGGQDPERERAYSPSSCIGGHYQPFITAYRERSVQARAEAAALGGRWLRVPVGTAALPAIELCLPPPAGPGRTGAASPLLVFIHGGYWQELSAADSLFAAARCIARGIAFAAIDYTLAPAARVGGIVDECRAALARLALGAARWGLDPRRIVVAGSSAGAHLAAMVSLPSQAAPAAAAVLVSGVYELTPLVGTSINDALGMDLDEAAACSPQRAPLAGFPPALVVWGEVETEAFKQQSGTFADALHAVGTPCRRFEVPARNHFDVILDLAEPGTLLGDATLALLGPR